MSSQHDYTKTSINDLKQRYNFQSGFDSPLKNKVVQDQKQSQPNVNSKSNNDMNIFLQSKQSYQSPRIQSKHQNDKVTNVSIFGTEENQLKEYQTQQRKSNIQILKEKYYQSEAQKDQTKTQKNVSSKQQIVEEDSFSSRQQINQQKESQNFQIKAISRQNTKNNYTSAQSSQQNIPEANSSYNQSVVDSYDNIKRKAKQKKSTFQKEQEDFKLNIQEENDDDLYFLDPMFQNYDFLKENYRKFEVLEKENTQILEELKEEQINVCNIF